jgi:large repetitive protein
MRTHTPPARRPARRWLGGVLAVAVVLGACELPPPAESGDDHVTADPLPTVQVNGVVWDQEIVGNTVFAVGEFTSARPAGAAPGVSETPRSNILAYDIRTGALITSFAPTVNRQIKTVTASPDRSRVYIGGQFTSVNGVSRFRIAALDPTTGALITGFNAIVDYTVNALVATATTVYAAGAFGFAGPGAAVARPRLAAFSATNGALLTWAPSANAEVRAAVLSPDGSRLFVGGSFTAINGSDAYGLAAIDAANGALVPWAANNVVRDAGSDAAILSLASDGTSIYGSGYHFGGGGNLEGAFSADPDTGDVHWIEDCHGDTYSVAPVNGYLYTASHAHYCGNLGGFPQSDPWSTNLRHALSFTASGKGSLRRDPLGYYNWEGTRGPSLVHWFPEWQVGTYTGQNQAVWSVAGNGQYVVYGGEFLRVNNVPQQGLVRFAVRPIAPRTSGPQLSSAGFPINVRSTAPGQVRISFPANVDRDDRTLNYRISRDGVEVETTQAASTFWERPIVAVTDTGLAPGQTHTYRVRVTDADGNTALSDPRAVTVATSGSPSPYADTVMADGALIHWRLDEPAGSSTSQDELGFDDATVDNGVALGAPGALLNESTTAASFTGSSTSRLYSTNRTWGDDTLSVEAWFRTSSTQGGRIVGFADNTTSTSTRYDRHLYVTNDGRVVFGTWTPVEGTGPGLPTEARTVASQAGLNNDQWHHVVGTLGPDGMQLFVDGVRVASRGDTTVGDAFHGSWKVGSDTLAGWPDRPTSDTFVGQIDEVAIYHKVLADSQVANHYAASGR